MPSMTADFAPWSTI